MTLTGLSAGSYTIYIRDFKGCTDSETVIVAGPGNCIVDQGCTPGYWKNHTDAWAATVPPNGYSQPDINTDFFLYFGISNTRGIEKTMDSDGNGSLTFLEAISAEIKTSDNNGWFAELARHAVAALLNATHPGVGYAMSPLSIIELTADTFNDPENLYGNGKKGQIAANTEAKRVATILKGYNELYCPLGNENDGLGSIAETNKQVETVELTAISDFKIYPVPFSDVINIGYEFDYVSDVSIQIFDMRGQLLRTYRDYAITAGSVTTINVDFAVSANQMYIVKLITDRESLVKQITSSKK